MKSLREHRARALPSTAAAAGLAAGDRAPRLGINRRTVAQLVAGDEPPGYRRAALGSLAVNHLSEVLVLAIVALMVFKPGSSAG